MFVSPILNKMSLTVEALPISWDRLFQFVVPPLCTPSKVSLQGGKVIMSGVPGSSIPSQLPNDAPLCELFSLPVSLISPTVSARGVQLQPNSSLVHLHIW